MRWGLLILLVSFSVWAEGLQSHSSTRPLSLEFRPITESGWVLQKMPKKASLDYEDSLDLVNDYIQALYNAEHQLRNLKFDHEKLRESAKPYHQELIDERVRKVAELRSKLEIAVAECNRKAPFEGLAEIKPTKPQPSSVAVVGEE